MEIMAALQQIDALMRARRFGEAAQIAAQTAKQHPDHAGVWRSLGQVQEATGDFKGMQHSFEALCKLTPNDAKARLKLAQAHVQQGAPNKALPMLEAVVKGAGADAFLLLQAGQLYTHLALYPEAYNCFACAVEIRPDDAQALYNLATGATALGKLEEAEKLFSRVIAVKPDDYDAYYNRSTLRKWTADDNHIAEMEGLLKAGIPDRKGAVQLFHALAKEYEDLGDAPNAFAHLRRGADLRASMMAYHVSTDTDAMADIAAAFDERFYADLPKAEDGPGPIFIVGLPRTGTTLVDRVLSSHTDVGSLGEIHDFVTALTRLCGQAKNKKDLIEKSTRVDMSALGAAYLESTRARGVEKACLIDKTPANFLYLGLIAKALPRARIIHLTRHPMDAGYAIYKTLFRLGYPYSYRLQDIAAYMAAYRQLMAHWHQMMPGRILDVAYEDMVQDIEGQARRMLSHCGLDWQPAVTEFHKNTSPSATASAAQVRQPLYSGSVGRWKAYEDGLKPLQDALIAAGVPL